MKKRRFETYFEWLVKGVFIAQLAVLIYMNLTQLHYHLGYDMSINFINTIQMSEQGKMLIDNWQNTTFYPVISNLPVAALFYSLTNNIYLSFGLTNIIFLILILAVFGKLLRNIGCTNISYWIALNLVICPYVTCEYNSIYDLSYNSLLLLGPSFYCVPILLWLICILHISKEKKSKWFYVEGIIITLVVAIYGATSGLLLWSLCLVSGVAYYFFEFLIKENVKYLKSYGFIFFLTNVIMSIIAKVVLTKMLNLSTAEGAMRLSKSGELFENGFNAIAGFIEFLAGLPAIVDVSVIGKVALFYLLAWVCIICLVFTFVFFVYRLFKKEGSDVERLLIFVVLENICFFLIVDVSYGGAVFENRYWVFSLFSLFLLSAVFFSKYAKKYLNCALMLAIVFAILGLDMYGDYLYLQKKINYDELSQIEQVVDEYDSPVVYTYGTDINLEMCNLRVIDNDKVYRIMEDSYNTYRLWGDYTHYRDVAEYTGENCLVATSVAFDTLPDYLKNAYTPVNTIGKYTVYYSETNVFDLTNEMQLGYSKDLPYSFGYTVKRGKFDEKGSWVTNGKKGYCLYGPGVATVSGKYDVILNYEMLEEGLKECYFDICIDGNTVLEKVKLDKDSSKAVLKGIEIEDGHTIEYRVYNAKGAKLRIDSIEVKGVSQND